VECATDACLLGFVARLAVAITSAGARRWWSSELKWRSLTFKRLPTTH
jgi:hypothetical protein